MQQKLSKAWQLFDLGEYTASESLYLECFNQVGDSKREEYLSVLMGLIYVESFLKKYDEAREYAKLLVNAAQNEEERHIAIHQFGMVERMAGNYGEAMWLFLQEAELILETFPNADLPLSANLYERAYVELKIGNIDSAEGLMNMSMEHAKIAKDNMSIGCSYRGMGEILQVRGVTDRAHDCFKKAIYAFSEAGDQIAVEEVKAMAEMLEQSLSQPIG